MVNHGRNINLFLMDGDPTARIKCTLANWTGVAYKIPRTEIDKCKNREDLKQSGVYFLFGISEETGENIVYIGQAGARKNGEGILNRLQEHKRDESKDYWTEAVIFTTSNNSFGPTEISFLENKFCNMAKEANRYVVKNITEPSMGNVTEEKESELEEFAFNSKIIMGTLGYKIFELLVKEKGSKENNIGCQDDDLLLFLKRRSKKSNIQIDARCKRTKEGFVVLSGSKIEIIDSNSIPLIIKEERKKAKIEKYILQENKLFNSPSYAAAFVIGGHANGLTEWKTKDGKTLKEFEKKE